MQIYFDSIFERDSAINKISDNNQNFMSHGLIALSKLKTGEYTGEDIRIILTKIGLRPNHPNAWGALVMSAIKFGILINTGKVTKMKTKTSHARKTSIYKLIDIKNGGTK